MLHPTRDQSAQPLYLFIASSRITDNRQGYRSLRRCGWEQSASRTCRALHKRCLCIQIRSNHPGFPISAEEGKATLRVRNALRQPPGPIPTKGKKEPPPFLLSLSPRRRIRVIQILKLPKGYRNDKSRTETWGFDTHVTPAALCSPPLSGT